MAETQLILTIQDLVHKLNAGEQTDAILLDFSKAFDKVPHRRLLLKLQHYIIGGNILAWIQDILSDSTQEVVLDGYTSSRCSVTSGVPQGTVLGPLLFLVYINDMPSCIQSPARLFADTVLSTLRSVRLPIARNSKRICRSSRIGSVDGLCRFIQKSARLLSSKTAGIL